VAETAEEYAARCVDLLGDAGRRRAMGAAAREFVVERFSWEPSCRRLEGLLEELVHAVTASGAA
jgi:glycosyltransferase involved in cell wall biosynthesis